MCAKRSSSAASSEAVKLMNSRLESLKCKKKARMQMADLGFCALNSDDFVLTKQQSIEFQGLQNHFNKLPRDPYDKNANRFRQLSRCLLVPFADMLIPRPERVSVFKQDVGFNDEAAGVKRNFQPIPEAILSCDFIRTLIMHDFRNSPFDEYWLSLPIEVGIHFIRLQAEPGKPGISIPNRLHKDGEPFTWIHLVNRQGVTGGENVVTDNSQRDVLYQATLMRPLDSLGIVDDRVWHQVKPVYANDRVQVGFRDVMLIDFTPMVAQPLKPKEPA